MGIAFGLDLSLTGSGIAREDGLCWSVGQEGVTKLPLHQQLKVVDELSGMVSGLVVQDAAFHSSFIVHGLHNSPDLVVIEGLDMAQRYGGQIPRTAMWWLVVRELKRQGIPFVVATSTQVKQYCTGSGAADKKAMVAAVSDHWPHFQHGGDNNKADASAMCAMAAELAGRPMWDAPAKNRAVLSKLQIVRAS